MSERLGVAMHGIFKNVKKISTEYHVWYRGNAVYELRKLFHSKFQNHYPEVEFEENERDFHELKQNRIKIEFGKKNKTLFVVVFIFFLL